MLTGLQIHMKKLLLNFVYYRPVGHAVEAPKYAKGYYEGSKGDIEIHLLLNADTPVELAEACPWITKTFAIDIREVMDKKEQAVSLKDIPREWDYVISDSRVTGFQKGWDEDDLMQAQAVLQKYFTAEKDQGYTVPFSPLNSADTSTQVLPYSLNSPIHLAIPTQAKDFAQRYSHNGPKIALMLGGSAGDKQSPSTEMWLKVCQALLESIPDLKLYFTGLTQALGNKTTTIDFTLDDVHALAAKLPNVEVVYNVGLWNQLALIESCDIFLSPHTGFAFLAPTVGTSWLALSNCRWQEYLFNNVPFYSVIPDCGSYPAQKETEIGCGKLLAEDKKALCMTDELLEKKIPEIVEGVKLLLNSNFTYDKAMELYLEKLQKLSTYAKFSFFDGAAENSNSHCIH